MTATFTPASPAPTTSTVAATGAPVVAPPVTRRARTASRSLWKAGAVAGAGAAVATTTIAAVAKAADVSLAVGGEAIPTAGFAQLTLVSALIGIVLAVVLDRRAARPARTFLVTTGVLTALSFVPDVLADATTATKLVLVLTHVVAAAIVVPVLARRLAR